VDRHVSIGRACQKGEPAAGACAAADATLRAGPQNRSRRVVLRRSWPVDHASANRGRRHRRLRVHRVSGRDHVRGTNGRILRRPPIADIFISYRHGETDGWAATSLHEKLVAAQLDAFFDSQRKSLDLGDPFPQRIASELAACSIVLAVIGRDWRQAVARLHDKDDWVCRELAISLADPDKRVVPVMLSADAKMPAAELLPALLHPLLDRLGMPINVTGFSLQASELLNRVHQWLKRPALLTHHASRSPVPEGLPFLCDRSDQRDELIRLLKSANRPTMAACVVHGHKYESHNELLERFLDEGTIASGLKCDDPTITTAPLRPGREKLRRGEFAEGLKLAFKAGVLDDPGASDAELCTFLEDLQSPLVAELQVTWAMFNESAPDLVNGLIAAWKGLPACAGSAVRLPFTALLWINLTYDDLETNLEKDLEAPLPKLPSLDEQDLVDWLRVPQVKTHAEPRRRELLAVLEDPDYHLSPGRVQMMRFADAFKIIMSIQ
jgi:hypothetical protein